MALDLSMISAEYIADYSENSRGLHLKVYFENGYGASIISSDPILGIKIELYELAVLKWDGEGNWELDYSTPITRDVIPNLSPREVIENLRKVSEL